MARDSEYIGPPRRCARQRVSHALGRFADGRLRALPRTAAPRPRPDGATAGWPIPSARRGSKEPPTALLGWFGAVGPSADAYSSGRDPQQHADCGAQNPGQSAGVSAFSQCQRPAWSISPRSAALKSFAMTPEEILVRESRYRQFGADQPHRLHDGARHDRHRRSLSHAAAAANTAWSYDHQGGHLRRPVQHAGGTTAAGRSDRSAEALSSGRDTEGRTWLS